MPSSSFAAPPGRIRARVFAFNPKKGLGHARLPDSRTVWLALKDAIQPDAKPLPGDIVELRLEQSPRGLEGREIKIIPKVDEPEVASSTAKTTTAEVESKPPETLSSPDSTIPVSAKPSPPGTIKAEQLYQKAALARTEGRIEESRQLFRQAIEAGAGEHVYIAFFKMEMERGSTADARPIVRRAIDTYPDQPTFYDMYGHMERRLRRYQQAEQIFRQGLIRSAHHASLRWGLGQTLVQIGTEGSLLEASAIFDSLDQEGKLRKSDGIYQRFKILERNARAARAYDFFQSAGMKVGIVLQKDSPAHITDMVAEISKPEFSESFGLDGSFLVRCFQRAPRQIEVVNLGRSLRQLGAQSVLGLQGGGEVVLNSSLAFMAVPSIDAVRDQVMSTLSDSNEALVPLNDAMFRDSEDPLQTLRDLLGQYLGLRDLYSSTLPVSGRRFFGRERLLLQLTDEVRHGQFLGIYGLRKIGKTSLIYQLRDEKLRGEAVAYVDLQASIAPTIGNCNPLYWELERDLYLRLVERNPRAAEHLRLGKVERFSDLPESGTRARLLFTEDLRSLLDALTARTVSGIKHIVIVLDELERILPVGNQPGISGYIEFFGLLRGLAQMDRYRDLLSNVVVAANAAISERAYWEGRENPVFALYKTVFLPPLSESESVEMISSLGRGMSVHWEPAAMSAVFSETGGHPFLTRALCSRITKQNLTRPINITAQIVQSQIEPFIRYESDKLEQIIELLRTNFPKEERFLQQIALDRILSDISYEALGHLLGYRLIAAEEGSYQITLNLLRRWLRRRAGIKA